MGTHRAKRGRRQNQSAGWTANGIDRDAGFLGREGNTDTRGAATGCRRLRESIAPAYGTAVRSDGSVRVGARWALQRHVDAKRPAFQFALQHLCLSGTSAGADRESGRSGAARGAGAGANQLPVFCGKHPRRPLFWCDAGGTQQKRAKVSPSAGWTSRRSSTRGGSAREEEAATEKSDKKRAEAS